MFCYCLLARANFLDLLKKRKTAADLKILVKFQYTMYKNTHAKI